MSRVHVVFAVKQLTIAKTRLSGFLTHEERKRLALAMLCDTATAARAADGVESVTVVTADSRVATLAGSLGASVVAEPPPIANPDAVGQPRLNNAYRAGITAVRAAGGTDIVLLQADLPALRTAELTAAYATAKPYGGSFVSDRHETGTAALILKDGANIVPMFGPSSARRHREAGNYTLNGNWPGLRSDVDTVQDMRLASSLGVGSATAALLASMTWRESVA
ncbi:2-phospho-L-lactate guanylyltransferase [Rhodococcus fascians]|nr:2-phospho-L-lactate guanylyltransferase [Rhodococcus fascians]MBY4237913.1 2-phospho-L-lactate guanylyltransferase [Rhodococcus fascians]MBY4253336.1 2-phospho-L-lactate guanylyltransferase [Rhodococcus fascians]MBY4268973.1 2-phospho-L-lactate guanylyltransferase [Rhodococcus fascians]